MKSMIRKSAAFLALSVGFTGTAVGAKFVATEETDIIGEVQKPDVTVVISRENLNKAYELDLKESFIDKIIESVEHAPF